MSYMGPNNATVTVIPGTAASISFFPEASHSSGRMIYNGSTAPLYLYFGTAAASTTNFTTIIPTVTTFTFVAPVYAGAVQGYWAAANGSAWTTYW